MIRKSPSQKQKREKKIGKIEEKNLIVIALNSYLKEKKNFLLIHFPIFFYFPLTFLLFVRFFVTNLLFISRYVLFTFL